MALRVEILKGKILTSIEQEDDDRLIFSSNNGKQYNMFHWQDCCEDVYIEDICGDLSDLIGSPILIAEERCSHDETPDGILKPDHYVESYTWTFFEFATIKGSVTIRWYGSSSGHYSESVSFIERGGDW